MANITDEEAEAMLRSRIEQVATGVQSKNVDSKVTGELQLEIPKKRDFNIKRIGNIAYTNASGSYSGCKLMEWGNTGNTSAAEDFNQFFTDNANLMVVDMWVDDTGQITAIVTNTLTHEQLEVIKTRSSLIEQEVQKIMEANEAANLVQEKAVATKADEMLELAKVGEHCQKNHGGLIKQIRAKAKGKK